MTSQIFLGNCEDELKNLPDNSVDSVVTDPPYELGFMGKSWDSTGIAYNVDMWKEVLRVLKPGGYLLSFGGSRTYHRMACAIEDAGFEIRDQIMWVYGSGFPKSLNVSKSIEGLLTTGSANKTAFKHLAGEQVERGDWGIAKQQFTHGQRDTNYDETASATRLGKLEPTTDEAKQWDGWGTALKPAHEPIVLARKPLSEKTVAKNVLEYGTGGINIDGSRIGSGTGEIKTVNYPDIRGNNYNNANGSVEYTITDQGRWPANFIHDGLHEDWARYFYCAKTSKKDRNEGLDDFEAKSIGPKGHGLNRVCATCGTLQMKGCNCPDATYINPTRANHHPTVKPTDLMRYLVRMVTPPNGVVLDPFMGSGSTGKAAILEGFNFIGVEQNPDYIAIAEARIEAAESL